VRLKRLSLLVVILSGLSACSTTQKAPNAVQIVEKPAQQPTPTSAQSLFERAQHASPAEQYQLYYLARDAALESQNWVILEQVTELLSLKASVDHVQNALYLAYARQQLKKYESALAILRNVEEALQSPSHRAWHQYLTGSIYLSQELPKKSLPHLFNAADIVDDEKLSITGLNDEIWQALQQLSSYALERFERGSVLQQGWVKLAQFQQVYLGKGPLFDEALNNWQRRYVNHPGSNIIPDTLRTKVQLAPYDVKRLAVLLPQSGNSERLGAALKNGILAALDTLPIEQVYFIDEMLSSEEIESQLSRLNVDFVIGPLLKNNVEKVRNAQLLQSRPTLFLNTDDANNSNPDHFYFALNPEHEVDQALRVFLHKGFQKPMVLAPQNASGQRLAERFKTQWSLFSESKPEIGFYTDSKNMAEVVATLLEVDASKNRIKDIKSLFKEEIDSETRSRADIDAIYILGDSTETRLLKPYLDVNVSTFAKRIPLFATSRSYSKRINITDKGDLEELYFTDQPWMIPGTEQRQLRDTYDALWPEQADIEQRLFSMAYDAVHVIGELKQLANIPGREFVGLSGRLRLQSSNQFIRSLSWAQYKAQSIVRVDFPDIQPTPLFMQESSTSSVSLLSKGIND
jgi:hypothetical protein